MVAGGGGPSSCTNYPSCTEAYAKPSWQSGTGVPSDGARDIPDLSLFAGDGFNGVFIFLPDGCQRRRWGQQHLLRFELSLFGLSRRGGTSASVQAFAGIMAMVNQPYGRQGNANYVLYPLAAQTGNTCNSNAAAVSNASCIFYDIDPTSGNKVNVNNSVICQGGSPNCSNTTSGQYGVLVSGSPEAAAYPTTAGYDLATGLGSVNVANLVNNWKSNFTPSTTTLAFPTPRPSPSR